MEQNKTSTSSEATVKAGKYFKYAIGEIILVVIGILIALQINNKNDKSKHDAEISKFYKNAIVDLEETSKATKIQIGWFKGYQDLNYLIYRQIINEIPEDTLVNYNNLIWSHSFRTLIKENYSNKFDQINHEKLQDLFRDAIWREQLVNEAVFEWNTLKFNTLRPFFFKYGINNTKESYNNEPYKFVTSKSIELIKANKLKAQFGTIEFDQILFELRHKTSWVIECLINQERSSENLRRALNLYLKADFENLNKIEPLNYYMND